MMLLLLEGDVSLTALFFLEGDAFKICLGVFSLLVLRGGCKGLETLLFFLLVVGDGTIFCILPAPLLDLLRVGDDVPAKLCRLLPFRLEEVDVEGLVFLKPFIEPSFSIAVFGGI